MLVLKGSEAAARIKKEVQEMVEGLGGHVPTAAIVRVGERPDDLSYERNVMKKIASFGMEARSFAFPESIREGEYDLFHFTYLTQLLHNDLTLFL